MIAFSFPTIRSYSPMSLAADRRELPDSNTFREGNILPIIFMFFSFSKANLI